MVKLVNFFICTFTIAVALALVNAFLKQIKNYHVKEKRNQLKFISNEFELSESELDINLGLTELDLLINHKGIT